MRYGCFSYLVLTLLVSSLSYGAVSVTNISGYSEIDRNSKVLNIFGGIVGSDSSCSGTGTCNNCDSTPTACNEVRVYDNTELNLDITSDSTSGTVLIRYEKEDETLADTGRDVARGTVAHRTIRWSRICNAASRGSGGCRSNSNVTLTIGVDGNSDNDLSDNEDDTTTIQFFITKPENPVSIDTVGDCNDSVTTNGICDFTAFPGDQKVFMDDLRFGEPNFNTSGRVKFNRLKVYISTDNFASALPKIGNVPPRELEFRAIGEGDNEFSVGDKTIGGLKNGVTYFFRLAVMDEANNIAYFTSEDYIKGATIEGPDGKRLKVCDSESEDFEAYTCPYAAIPQEVQGLLSEDFNCFIATAAYGSGLSPKVKTFRQFRDRFLLSNSMGRKFVRIYYKYGPLMAQWIAPKNVVRQIVRTFLWPAWSFAAMSLRLGLLMTIFIFFLMASFFTLIFSILLWRRIRHVK